MSDKDSHKHSLYRALEELENLTNNKDIKELSEYLKHVVERSLHNRTLGKQKKRDKKEVDAIIKEIKHTTPDTEHAKHILKRVKNECNTVMTPVHGGWHGEDK